MSCRPRPAEAPGRAGSRALRERAQPAHRSQQPLRQQLGALARWPQLASESRSQQHGHRAALATERESRPAACPGPGASRAQRTLPLPRNACGKPRLLRHTPLRNTARTHTRGRPNARRAHVRNYRWRWVCDCHVCTALSLVQDVFMSRPVTAYLSVSSSVHRTQSSCRRRGEDGPPGPRGAAWRSARLRAREALGEGSSWASLNHAPRTVGGRWSPGDARPSPGGRGGG